MTLLRAKPRPKLMFKIYKAAFDLTKDEIGEAMRQAVAKEVAEAQKLRANEEHGHDHGHDEHSHGHDECADDCCGHDHSDRSGAAHGHDEAKGAHVSEHAHAH
jgi:hypothetical protein